LKRKVKKKKVATATPILAKRVVEGRATPMGKPSNFFDGFWPLGVAEHQSMGWFSHPYSFFFFFFF
jgi:hypothetical protein